MQLLTNALLEGELSCSHVGCTCASRVSFVVQGLAGGASSACVTSRSWYSAVGAVCILETAYPGGGTVMQLSRGSPAAMLDPYAVTTGHG